MTSVLGASLSTLDRIRTKVRRLTASPSANQLTDPLIDDYINTFFLFDMSEHVRLFNLRTLYEFYTQPDIEAYAFPRQDFVNIYQPVYAAGYECFYTQSREQFYRIYPSLNFINAIGTGDGTAGPYNFQFTNPPILRGYSLPPGNVAPFTVDDNPFFSQVFLSGVTAAGTETIARDNGVGGFVDENGNILVGSINYTTGAVTGLVFAAAIVSGNTINGQSIPYQPSRPEAMLFYRDTMILRPVPDQSYLISMEVLERPTALFAMQNNRPYLEEWWQYIAYGAAKKVFEDRQDMGSVANIMPEFKEQQRLCLRRTTQQLAQERTATIFTEQVSYPYGNFFNRF